MYLALRYSWVFGKLAVMSPSVWWRNRAILKTVAQMKIKRKPELRIWLDIGTQEGQRALLDARALKSALVKKGWRLGEDLCYTEVEGGQHDEVAWSHRVAPMLQFLFPPRN
jgi:predicted alpha/beta superfamily hydrolase